MSVSVDICNSALIKLGAERINSLTDDNKRSRLCQEQYPKILERVLRSHPWKFAIKRKNLAQVVHEPEFTSGFWFEQPLDCLRVVGVMNASNLSETTRYTYKIEGRRINSELDAFPIKYISSDTPEAHYDADFKEAMANALAHDLCYALVQSNEMKSVLFQEYEFWIGQARSHGSMEDTIENLVFDTWTGDRI